MVAASVLVIVVSAVLLFQLAVPWAAERAAQRVPVSVEKAMGDQVLAMLQPHFLKPSGLPTDEETRLRVVPVERRLSRPRPRRSGEFSA